MKSDEMKRYIIGVDIGGTKTSVILADESGNTVSKLKEESEPEKGPDNLIEKIEAMITSLLEKIDKKDVLGIGVSFAGPVKDNKIRAQSNLPGWEKKDLKKIIEKKFHLSIVIENDANSKALAEKFFGVGKNVDNFIYITVSTGIGGGIIINGKLYKGRYGAGEIGHMCILPGGPKCGCGRDGCFEALASGTAIARMANMDAKSIGEAAEKGDNNAISIFEEIGKYLGIGIANLVNLFDPELIIIGGSVAKSSKFFLPSMEKILKEKVYFPEKPKIVISDMIDTLGNLGTIAIFLQEKGK